VSTKLNDGCLERFKNLELRVGEQEKKIECHERLANKFYGGFAMCGIAWAVGEIALKLGGKI